MTSKKQPIKQVWNSLNAHLRPQKKPRKWAPSQTVPDETMSLRELLHRQAHGLTIPDKTPVFLDEDGLGIDLRKMDKAEQAMVMKQAAEELESLAKMFEKQKIVTKKTAEAKRIADIEAAAVKRHLEGIQEEQSQGEKPE